MAVRVRLHRAERRGVARQDGRAAPVGAGAAAQRLVRRRARPARRVLLPGAAAPWAEDPVQAPGRVVAAARTRDARRGLLPRAERAERALEVRVRLRRSVGAARVPDVRGAHAEERVAHPERVLRRARRPSDRVLRRRPPRRRDDPDAFGAQRRARVARRRPAHRAPRGLHPHRPRRRLLVRIRVRRPRRGLLHDHHGERELGRRAARAQRHARGAHRPRPTPGAAGPGAAGRRQPHGHDDRHRDHCRRHRRHRRRRRRAARCSAVR
mmetsp:Transcript_54158/g.166641  ORF Transcript_54158/g.166641 Transcript_54158/m.166641 type:complete len:267 (-) Transcript_54158:383-1183(-)